MAHCHFIPTVDIKSSLEKEHSKDFWMLPLSVRAVDQQCRSTGFLFWPGGTH